MDDKIERLLQGIVSALQRAWEFLNQDVPEWLTELCTTIGRIVFSLLKAVGQEYIRQIEDKIIATSVDYSDKTSEEKFSIVWDFAHELLPSWKESKLDTLIQNIFIMLKEVGRI